MFLGILVSLALLGVMVARIGRRNGPFAVFSALFWPALLVAMVRYWGDDESDIRMPFLLFVPITVYAAFDLARLAGLPG